MKKYMTPDMDVVLTKVADVITASSEVNDDEPGMGEVGRG